MIHRLRRRHRRVWLALAILLPLLYAIALAARRPALVLDTLPGALRAEAAERSSPSEGAP